MLAFDTNSDEEISRSTAEPATHNQGPITRSRARKLQQEVHAFLAELHFNIVENFILPKLCTLILLRFLHDEHDYSQVEKEECHTNRPHIQTAEYSQVEPSEKTGQKS